MVEQQDGTCTWRARVTVTDAQARPLDTGRFAARGACGAELAPGAPLVAVVPLAGDSVKVTLARAEVELPADAVDLELDWAL